MNDSNLMDHAQTMQQNNGWWGAGMWIWVGVGVLVLVLLVVLIARLSKK